jgi:hypothetical protein
VPEYHWYVYPGFPPVGLAVSRIDWPWSIVAGDGVIVPAESAANTVREEPEVDDAAEFESASATTAQ